MKVQLDLLSDESVLDATETVVEKFLEGLEWGEDDVYWFSLAIREVLINAIVHGNRRDPGKNIHFLLTEEKEHVKAEILDEGDGGDIPIIPDALAPQNLLKPHGRGLHLARQISDEINFERTDGGGLKVTLIKSISQGGKNENSHRRTG